MKKNQSGRNRSSEATVVYFPSMAGLPVKNGEDVKFIRSLKRNEFNQEVGMMVSEGWTIHEMVSSFRKTKFGAVASYMAELRRSGTDCTDKQISDDPADVQNRGLEEPHQEKSRSSEKVVVFCLKSSTGHEVKTYRVPEKFADVFVESLREEEPKLREEAGETEPLKLMKISMCF